jgi:hypothetical protein
VKFVVSRPATPRHFEPFDTEAEAISDAKELAEAFPGEEVQVYKLLASVKSAPAVTYVEPKPEAPPIEKLREAAAKVPQGEPVEQRHAVAVSSLPTTLPPPNTPGGRIRRMPA